MRFDKGIGALDLRQIRDAVQGECLSKGLGPKDSFIVLFVTDEIVCNVMEHSKATWMEMELELSPEGFSASFKDDGVTFDAKSEVDALKGKAVDGENERHLGLNLIGRLVDKVDYKREQNVNTLNVSKFWQSA
jgi:anti-sigma regulatory factor (Ser/Thr protein kinase)